MKIEGTETLHAPRDRVWALLDDPQALASCTPGMQELRPTGPDEFEAVLSIGIAAVRGTYKGKLRITERTPPERYAVQVEGSSGAGFVRRWGSWSWKTRAHRLACAGPERFRWGVL